MKYVPPDGFFGIQILQNSISAGVSPRTPLGELTTLPSRLGRGNTPSPVPTPSTPSVQGWKKSGFFFEKIENIDLID